MNILLPKQHVPQILRSPSAHRVVQLCLAHPLEEALVDVPSPRVHLLAGHGELRAAGDGEVVWEWGGGEDILPSVADGEGNGGLGGEGVGGGHVTAVVVIKISGGGGRVNSTRTAGDGATSQIDVALFLHVGQA